MTEPELVKEILSNRNNNYPKIDLEGFFKKLFGDGVASSKGEKWVKMRKLANHVFHGESLKVKFLCNFFGKEVPLLPLVLISFYSLRV